MQLLTEASANAKTAKNGHGVLSYILHLAPAYLSGFNVCPAASQGCAMACLNTAGRGGIIKRGEDTNAIQQARIWRTILLHRNPTVFYSLLYEDLNRAVVRGRKLGLPVVVRLNGTSDLPWHDVIGDFPTIQFYDYTKRLDLLRRQLDRPLANYDLTFSRSEVNERVAGVALSLGFRVAVVFSGELPDLYLDSEVIDGDSTDLRYLDPKGVIVGLKAKGKARRDKSGFVVAHGGR